NGDSNVVSRTLRMGDRQMTIVGVMPRGFEFFNSEARYWIPLAFTNAQKNGRHSNNWFNIGRLKQGATLQQVHLQIDALNAANLDRFPQFKELLINAGFHTTVEPLKEVLVWDVKSTLYLLWGGASFVLLIGAVNIANLALARCTRRKKEFATRLALGAGRSQLLRHLAIESALVALAGGIGGVALGTTVLSAMRN